MGAAAAMRAQHPHTQGQGMASERARARLIEQLRKEGITNERVLAAITRVPRHLFLEEALASRAYDNSALPIGYGQTISQPLVVAMMTSLLFGEKSPRDVLEVGTGSGYQTAVLAELGLKVYSTERIQPLHERARKALRDNGYGRAQLRLSDGRMGLADYAPFDAIMVTAAADKVPQDLLAQLRVGGRLVMPVGGAGVQRLVVFERDSTGWREQQLDAVSFVPLLAGVSDGGNT